ncbi:hypothetical protein DNTS_005781 [Danionella cerebrum]|nr:hypothetical protein DNTS_005781 [Danionella translucida]
MDLMPELDFLSVLRSLQEGSAPALSSEDLASRISACVRPPPVNHSFTEITCLSLSLTETMISGLLSHKLPPETMLYYEDVIRRLFGELKLMERLVSLFGCQERLLAHISTKCISVYLVSDICKHGGISKIWSGVCATVFEESVSGMELDSCLWSVTAVIKGVLRGKTPHRKQDLLRNLFSSLESSITALFSNLLPGDPHAPPDRDTSTFSKSLSEFLELLETLSAARFRLGLCSSVQRLIFTQTQVLLHITRADVGYFVKKRVLLLLKRSLLRRSGEDWDLGDALPESDECLSEDSTMMADAVLQEVNAGWLKKLPVKEQVSYLGGNCDGGVQKDGVVVRAVSLILLKSLEINAQGKVANSELVSSMGKCLSELMRFLHHHNVLATPNWHRCCWVSAAFAEQDDDMMESNNTLIRLYSHHRSLVSGECSVCIWGLNPHCHFLLLLRSLGFDHSVLLDFLISSETCFLEYCVRYLRILQHDCSGFYRSCQLIQNRDGKLECTSQKTEDYDSSCRMDDYRETSSGQAELCSDAYRLSAGSEVKTSLAPKLVDYGSSEESEEAEDTISEGNKMDTEAGGKAEAESLSGKVFECLIDLKTAVCRLQSKGLFPYNPSSLIKLLNNVESLKHDAM